jgi:hypothetical protein
MSIFPTPPRPKRLSKLPTLDRRVARFTVERDGYRDKYEKARATDGIAYVG